MERFLNHHGVGRDLLGNPVARTNLPPPGPYTDSDDEALHAHAGILGEIDDMDAYSNEDDDDAEDREDEDEDDDEDDSTGPAGLAQFYQAPAHSRRGQPRQHAAGFPTAAATNGHPHPQHQHQQPGGPNHRHHQQQQHYPQQLPPTQLDDGYGDGDEEDSDIPGELSDDEAIYERLGIDSGPDTLDTRDCFFCDYAKPDHASIKDTRLCTFIAEMRRDSVNNFRPRFYINLGNEYEERIRRPANAAIGPGQRPLPEWTPGQIYKCAHFHRQATDHRVADELTYLFRSIISTVRKNNLVVRSKNRRRRDGRLVKRVQKDAFKMIYDASREIRQLRPFTSDPIISGHFGTGVSAAAAAIPPGSTYKTERMTDDKRRAQLAAASSLASERPAKRQRHH